MTATPDTVAANLDRLNELVEHEPQAESTAADRFREIDTQVAEARRMLDEGGTVGGHLVAVQMLAQNGLREALADARKLVAFHNLFAALSDLLMVIAADTLIPESVSYMVSARTAIAEAVNTDVPHRGNRRKLEAFDGLLSVCERFYAQFSKEIKRHSAEGATMFVSAEADDLLFDAYAAIAKAKENQNDEPERPESTGTGTGET